jgi:hypothetical protein
VTTSGAGIPYNHCLALSSTFDFDGSTQNCNNFTLVYRGYLYAGQTGTYDFSVTASDDAALAWAGPAAYSGWSRANDLPDVTFFDGGRYYGSYNAVAGDYVPIRIIFSQGIGDFNMGVQITAPDGSTALDTVSPSPFLVQKSCNGKAAPPFPSFGQEIWGLFHGALRMVSIHSIGLNEWPRLS